MSNNHRELTGREKQRIKKLITSLCANHDKEYGCLPLDCECSMFGICYTNSALCSYFRKSVLPEDAEFQILISVTAVLSLYSFAFYCIPNIQPV